MTESMPVPPNPPEYMTWVQGRRPEYRLHKTLGHASNSVAGNTRSYRPGYKVHYFDPSYDHDRNYEITRDCAIYQWDENSRTWQEMFSVSAGTSWADRPWKHLTR